MNNELRRATNKFYKWGYLWILIFIVSQSIAACTLFPETTWAYTAQVKVVDSAGIPVQNAAVRSTDGQERRTNSDGIAPVYYMNRGLHVITVSADGLETTQSKTNMPSDSGKEITIVLKRTLSSQ